MCGSSHVIDTRLDLFFRFRTVLLLVGQKGVTVDVADVDNAAGDNDNDTDTLTEGQPTSVRKPGSTDMSDGVITPGKRIC